VRATFVLLATLGVVAQSGAEAGPPNPTPTAIVTATPAPHLMGLGFGEKTVPQPTATSSQPSPDQAGSLASVASRIKLRKLAPDDLKSIHSADQSSRAMPDTPPTSGGLASDEQREAAMQMFEDTFKVLHQRYLEVEAERRACNSACRGRTSGSAFTTDVNGNWVVLDTSVDNSTTPQCRQCQTHWRAEAEQVASDYKGARDEARAQGVFDYELDSHRLVFGNASK